MSEYNLQALAAMDDCEHATGVALKEHERRAKELNTNQPPHGGFSLEQSNGTS